MAQISVWPSLGLTITMEDGVTIVGAGGAVLTYTDEVRNKLDRAILLDYDPRPSPSEEVDAPTATIEVGAPLTVVDLFTRGGAYQGQPVVVNNYDTGVTSGAGEFRWDGASVATHDAGVTVGTSGTGRWIRTDAGNVQFSWWGPESTGVTAVTTKLQAAVTAASGKTLEITSGTYLVNGTITVPANTRIVGTGGTIKVDLTSSFSGDVFACATGCRVEGLKFTGNGSATTTANKYIITFRGTSGTHLSDCRVERCEFTNLEWIKVHASDIYATHAVYALYVDRMVCDKNVFRTIGGAAVFLSGVSQFSVDGNEIDNTGWYSIQLQWLCTKGSVNRNRITGSVSGRRDWGGSINVMSNGVAGPGEGLGRCTDIEIRGNYISGYHSYNAAIYLQSARKVLVDGNIVEGYLASAGGIGAATDTNYIRVRTRTSDGTDDEGACENLTISNNILIANDTQGHGIYINGERFGGATGANSGLIIKNNHVLSVDSTHYFVHAIIVHGGASGGWSNVEISGNNCSGFPTSASPVEGLVGVKGADATYTVDGFKIIDNDIRCVGGTATGSTHLGLAVGDYSKNGIVENNSARAWWHAVRFLSLADPSTRVGSNSIVGTVVGGADFLASAAPGTGSIMTGSATYNPANLEVTDGATTTLTVTGARVGDYAEASFSADLQGVSLHPWVSADNTVSVRFRNESANLITATAAYNPAALNDGDGVTATITVTGAALGDIVMASFDQPLLDCLMTAWVSATDEVKVRFQNETTTTPVDIASGNIRVQIRKATGAINLASGTLRARVRKA